MSTTRRRISSSVPAGSLPLVMPNRFRSGEKVTRVKPVAGLSGTGVMSGVPTLPMLSLQLCIGTLGRVSGVVNTTHRHDSGTGVPGGRACARERPASPRESRSTGCW